MRTFVNLVGLPQWLVTLITYWELLAAGITPYRAQKLSKPEVEGALFGLMQFGTDRLFIFIRQADSWLACECQSGKPDVTVNLSTLIEMQRQVGCLASICGKHQVRATTVCLSHKLLDWAIPHTIFELPKKGDPEKLHIFEVLLPIAIAAFTNCGAQEKLFAEAAKTIGDDEAFRSTPRLKNFLRLRRAKFYKQLAGAIEGLFWEEGFFDDRYRFFEDFSALAHFELLLSKQLANLNSSHTKEADSLKKRLTTLRPQLRSAYNNLIAVLGSWVTPMPNQRYIRIQIAILRTRLSGLLCRMGEYAESKEMLYADKDFVCDMDEAERALYEPAVEGWFDHEELIRGLRSQQAAG